MTEDAIIALNRAVARLDTRVAKLEQTNAALIEKTRETIASMRELLAALTKQFGHVATFMDTVEPRLAALEKLTEQDRR